MIYVTEVGKKALSVIEEKGVASTSDVASFLKRTPKSAYPVLATLERKHLVYGNVSVNDQGKVRVYSLTLAGRQLLRGLRELAGRKASAERGARRQIRISLSEPEIEAIDDWRRKRNMSTRNAAIRDILGTGLTKGRSANPVRSAPSIDDEDDI